MSKRNIPSEEDFRRADAADRERHRGLSEVSEQIKNRFEKSGVHEVFMFYSSKTPNTFYSRIFYRWTRQIEEAEKSGLASRIKDAVYEELERVGRGDRKTIKVDFEFDSHENVERDYGGNYFNRLR
ncbi:MAG TPA: hypothetical protein EYP10_15305 [Armatimonadetes bacterium]|nr:hypothetical protein [Armatimonadota bacterium]